MRGAVKCLSPPSYTFPKRTNTFRRPSPHLPEPIPYILEAILPKAFKHLSEAIWHFPMTISHSMVLMKKFGTDCYAFLFGLFSQRWIYIFVLIPRLKFILFKNFVDFKLLHCWSNLYFFLCLPNESGTTRFPGLVLILFHMFFSSFFIYLMFLKVN